MKVARILINLIDPNTFYHYINSLEFSYSRSDRCAMKHVDVSFSQFLFVTYIYSLNRILNHNNAVVVIL
jgi:hypothetical protein